VGKSYAYCSAAESIAAKGCRGNAVPRFDVVVGLTDGVRESAQSWRELFLDLKRRGLATGPELEVADGAPGFWQGLEEVWPQTRGQRCWVHKTANVLNKLPKSPAGYLALPPGEVIERAVFSCSVEHPGRD
jgi:transposase-like protein